jgi:hypothetical protein
MFQVERLILVPVDEKEIQERRIKKDRHIPIKYDDSIPWNNTAKVRKDWASTEWKKNSLHGWIWYDKDDTILGILYVNRNKEHELLIQKELTENPN